MGKAILVPSQQGILTRGKSKKTYEVFDCDAIRNKPKEKPKPTLLPLNQDITNLLAEQGLEICPYLRNANLEMGTPRAYGQCALTKCYEKCPRHKIDPIGQQGCYRYNQIWNSENAENVSRLDVKGLIKMIDTKSS